MGKGAKKRNLFYFLLSILTLRVLHIPHERALLFSIQGQNGTEGSSSLPC